MSCPHASPQPNLPHDAAAPASRFWRSLDELAGDEQFAASLAEEFPRHASAWDGRTDRRRFLELMGSSLALAGMAGCSSPPLEPIMPYVRSPRELTPGVAQLFATALPRTGGALGIVVASHMGRPIKIEGNPQHPASLGATDAQAQATILTMYDPDRSQTARRGGEIAAWDEFVVFLHQQLQDAGRGGGMRILSRPLNSPTLLRQRDALLARFPDARWHHHHPLGPSAALAGAEHAFGRKLSPIYGFGDADIVVSLDADFLSCGPTSVRYAHDFMARRVASGDRPFNRLYVVESTFTSTGAAADHRRAATPREVQRFARRLYARLHGGALPPGNEGEAIETALLDAVVDDLERNRGRGIVIVGEEHPPEIHALIHAINAHLGNHESTIQFIAPAGVTEPPQGTLSELAQDMHNGDVETLLLIDVNPVYDAPPDLEFAAALRKVKAAVHFGMYDDETAELCRWHLPEAHDLESWSDAWAYDGTVSIVQPLIAPLYDGKTVHELLSLFIDPAPRNGYDIVRETWQTELADGFDSRWHAALSDGIIAGTALPFESADIAGDVAPDDNSGADGTPRGDAFELILRPDPSIGDGRLANNAWLQELPRPLTKVTWENAVLVSPADASRLGLADGDIVRLDSDGRQVSGPACVSPGQPKGGITCHLGSGRWRAGRVGTGLGFNAYRLRGRDEAMTATGVTLTKTGGRVELARTQKHHAIDGRNIVHTTTVEQFRGDPRGVLPDALHHPLPSLYPEEDYDQFAWGMSIDLSKCVGCNACVVACQAENNVPVVGKEQVLRSREMHWLRIDTYFMGDVQSPRAVHQPMLCQHCEKAPCEVVCPVAATTHSDEGLNEMTYNRCIGTRYCSNNCPYKVRRFNFFDYTSKSLPVVELGRNPDVTVRSRGVMEKCTYCVQRINRARIDAKKQVVETGGNLHIQDGFLQTACQQACPSRAIVFGDLNDPQSRVSQLKADPRNYGALSELGTQPRTTYLAQLRNPHPRLG